MALLAVTAANSFAAAPIQQSAAGAARPVPRTPDGKPDFSGMWMWASVAGFRNEPPPYQPWAAAKHQEFRNRLNIDDPMGRCLLIGVPRITTMPMSIKIVQQPNELVFLYEAFRGIRVVPVDGRGHPDDLEPGFLGDSVGRWEGDTLVVDVTGFNGRTWLAFGASHHTDALHVTERYTRTDYETILYEVTMEDSKAFTKPWTTRSTIKFHPEERIREYECIDNNQEPERFEELQKTDPIFNKK